MKRKILSLLIAFVAVCGLSVTSNANTITVINTNDTGSGSLRDAIATANDSDTIAFNLSGCPCTIVLTSAPLSLSKSVFVNGPGADQLTISGNNAQTIFVVPTGLPRPITISGLTIANGQTTSNGGGMVINTGPVTILNCVLRNNSAPTFGSGSNGGGGAIFLSSGALNIINSTISNNSCGGAGAGIAMSASSPGLQQTLVIAHSTFSQNTATGGGGAVLVRPTGTLTSLNSDYTNNSAATAGAIACLGAAIVRGGTFTLNHVTSIGGGGGMFVVGGGAISVDPAGVAELTGVTISNNDTVANDHGGGVYNQGTLSVAGCVISNNKADDGGGIYSSGSMTVTDSTISGNMAVSTEPSRIGGGGVKSLGTATITGSTISGNSATSVGGGIFINAPLTLVNSTVSGNQVTALSGSGTGGGIHCASSATANLTNCTIAFNSSPNQGGGLMLALATGMTINVGNTIIALNTGNPSTERNVRGACISQGFNLIGSATSASGFTNGVNSDIVGGGIPGIDPLLAPLANNGGPTQTHALQTGSPAIDKGSSGFSVTTDQRGQPRFVDVSSVSNVFGGNFSDIGAYEVIPLQLTAAASRKTHGIAGTFDIDMPLTGASGIEDRSGGAYTLVLKFSNAVTAGNAAVTAGTGTVSGVTFNNKEMVVNLSGVANAQVLTLTASNVADTGGQLLNAAGVNVGFLIGDTSGNHSVNATDVSQTKLQSGAIVTAANFREDINASGSINATDIGQVKTSSGTSLPVSRGRDRLATTTR